MHDPGRMSLGEGQEVPSMAPFCEVGAKLLPHALYHDCTGISYSQGTIIDGIYVFPLETCRTTSCTKDTGI